MHICLLAILEELKLHGGAYAFSLDLVHVLFHEHDLADQVREVFCDGLKELVQRNLDLLHFLLEAADALLELLAECLVVLLGLGRFGDELLRGDVRYGLLLDVDVVVAGALVDDFDVGVLVLHDFVLDGRVVTVFRVILDFPVNLRVLREDLTQQELLAQSKRLHLRVSHMHKFSLDVVAQVVIAEEGI